MWTSRLKDHIEDNRRERQQAREEHREIRDAITKIADRADAAIKDLSDQTRGEFKSVRAETEKRHTENRKLMWSLAIMVMAAVLANYLAAYGFRSPAIQGDNLAATDAVKSLKGLLQQILTEEKQPVRPGGE